jgi:hypothetical protein
LTKRILANNSDLTPWFPPEVKPVHVGWYETCMLKSAIGHSYWCGKQWSGTYFAESWNKINLRFINFDGAIQNKSWRGLAVKAVQP